MKANELRIGNYYDHNGAVVIVTPNTIQDVFESERLWCKSIPLTEKWLVGFGFENGGYDLLFWSKKSSTAFFEISVVGNSFGVRYNNAIEPPLKYVHQLQNLYFALTGEELTLK